jgi:hypothetical protein
MVKSVEPWAIREFGPQLVHPTIGLDSFKAFTVQYHTAEEADNSQTEVDVELGKQKTMNNYRTITKISPRF